VWQRSGVGSIAEGREAAPPQEACSNEPRAHTPHNTHPPRIADARGSDPTDDSLDLSRPHPKKIKAEHRPHQIAATPHTVDPPRIADARGGDPTVESLDLSRPHPKKIKAEHRPHHIAAAWGRVGDARRATPAVSREKAEKAHTSHSSVQTTPTCRFVEPDFRREHNIRR
jgi:hypothetical protein